MELRHTVCMCLKTKVAAKFITSDISPETRLGHKDSIKDTTPFLLSYQGNPTAKPQSNKKSANVGLLRQN